MKAIVLHQFGDVGQFKLEEVKKPTSREDQVLINIKAIGINPVDTKVRAGTNRIAKNMELPAVIGWDVSGVISECGKEVRGLKEGDAVFGCIGFPGAGGAYAEYAVAEENSLALKPKSVSFEEAAAIPIVGLTAYQAIFEHLNIQNGQNLLIQAAAGGVGHISVQLAKQAGAYVIGTASASNKDFLLDLGIDRVIDYKKEKFEDRIEKVDAVQDAIGGEVLYRSINCTREGGKVLCLPSSTKNDPKAIELANARNISLQWPIMHPDKKQLEKLGELMDNRELKVNIDGVFGFEGMDRAHQAIETHSTRGKIVVKVG
ncbi:MAG TPA: NADP-dependent oxidoreductase [Salinimicrobium sp.]|nr:NADP-dependent oxidoreductase [Salinimicrobium sp.]